MIRIATLLLLLMSAGTVAAADAGTAVDRKAALGWAADFTAALRARDLTRLATLLDEPTPVTVQLVAGPDAPLVFTLTRAEYLQQLRALWRFASGTRYDATDLVYAAGEPPTLGLALSERWQLFGTDTGQHSRLQIQLAWRDDRVRAIAIHAITTPVPVVP